MGTSSYWFVVLAMCSAAGLGLGVVTAQRTRHRGRAALAVGLVLLGFWAYLLHHPAAAVRIVPVEVLSRVEGTAGVPVFMFIVGIAWVRSGRGRPRRLAGWAAVLGCVYFVSGGLWMLEATPQVGFAEAGGGRFVMQSRDDTCVAAACATALRVVGIESSEAEMAELTQTRPGTGSTLLRAMEGLRRKLAGTGWSVTLLEPTIEELAALPTPALTPMRVEPARHHMVTIVRADPSGLWVADPVDGVLFYTWATFEPFYNGRVLVLDR